MGKKKHNLDSLIKQAHQGLVRIEAGVRESDKVEDRIAAHAEDAQKRINRELDKREREGGNSGNFDHDAETAYLLGQHTHARRVQRLAALARSRR